ncbi:MAG TPA: ABC transporter substrate-binding protein [Ktedonobacterales bacterium]|nr:ABC transporter substrate-binding protein [Ktedonobacterales bacterium]
MPIYDRRQREAVDQLVQERIENSLSRREFVRRAVGLGLSFSAAGALLAACGGGTSTSNTVDLLNVWGGEELDSFKAVVAPFTSQTGIKVNLETTRDLNSVLTARIAAHNPPDIAILPNPGKMQQLAQRGNLIALDSFLDMSQIQADYASSWIDLGSYSGKLYAIFYKAANKGTIWYSPNQFNANHYTIPKTWSDMISLSNSIAGSGKYPWSMGVSSQAASGWPAADWIAQIFLNQSGGELYDKWVAHTIPWTHPAIKSAFQMFGQIVSGSHYINGAPQSILSTPYDKASYLPFDNPPGAYMYYLGDFTAGFITTQFPNLQPGTGFNFFPFPTINSAYAGAITGSADIVSVLRNTTAVQKLVKYLATAAAQEIWVKRGGFTSVNKSVPLSAYPDAVARASAQSLTAASVYRFGADDLMPPSMEDAFWKGMLDFITNTNSVDSVLSNLEATAVQAYASS